MSTTRTSSLLLPLKTQACIPRIGKAWQPSTTRTLVRSAGSKLLILRASRLAILAPDIFFPGPAFSGFEGRPIWRIPREGSGVPSGAAPVGEAKGHSVKVADHEALVALRPGVRLPARTGMAFPAALDSLAFPSNRGSKWFGPLRVRNRLR